MKYIKEHKFAVLAIVILLVLVVLAFQVIRMFTGDSNDAIYGNRLDGIEDVEITTSKTKNIVTKLEEDETISKVTVRLSGKIVEIVITTNDDTSLDTAKSYGNKVLELFDDKQKKYYDFQIFVKKTNDAKDFPIIGYKQNSRDNISWTKDRAAS